MFPILMAFFLLLNSFNTVFGLYAFFADGNIVKGLAGLVTGFLALICAYIIKGEFE